MKLTCRVQVSPAASPRKDGGQARAALAAAQKELADTRAALEAQKLTNSGLQACTGHLFLAVHRHSYLSSHVCNALLDIVGVEWFVLLKADPLDAVADSGDGAPQGCQGD